VEPPDAFDDGGDFVIYKRQPTLAVALTGETVGRFDQTMHDAGLAHRVPGRLERR
jgi:hypothetical protein